MCVVLRKKEMSTRRSPSPTLSFDDDDEAEFPPEKERKIMTPAEARDLPEAKILKIVNSNVSRDVSLYMLQFVSTLGIMDAATVSKPFVTKLLYTNEFWEGRWRIDFPDHFRELGPSIPNWCNRDTGDGIDIFPGGRPRWDTGDYIPWKKYWLWTWFFRRSLTRIFAEIFTQKAQQTMRRTWWQKAQQTMRRTWWQSPYTFVLKSRSSNKVVVSRAGAAEIFVLTMRQLVILSEGYRDVTLWGNETLESRLRDAISNSGPYVSLPLAAAFMSSNIIDQAGGEGLVTVPIGINRGAPTRYSISMQRDDGGVTRAQRDFLTQTYLNWYVFKTIGRNHPIEHEELEDNTSLILLIKQAMPDLMFVYHIINNMPGQQGNPRTHWFLELSELYNTPRVHNTIGLGDLEADANTGKIFLGDKVCANCGKGASKQCKRCKAVHYCGKKCQEVHWKGEHKSICEPMPIGSLEDHDFSASEPEIEISNWDYQFAAERYLKNFGKAKALQRLRDRFDDAKRMVGANKEMVYWWWAYRVVSEMPEFKAPISPPRFKYMELTYKHWALNAYVETEADPWDTPKSIEVRRREAIAIIESRRQGFEEGDDMYNFWTWVIHDIRHIGKE